MRDRFIIQTEEENVYLKKGQLEKCNAARQMNPTGWSRDKVGPFTYDKMLEKFQMRVFCVWI